MAQSHKDINDIFILVIDKTYGEADDDIWKRESEHYRQELEREFDREFREANIGSGADMPAFLTVLSTTHVPLWAALLAFFFTGKSISENLAAWADIARAIRRFFSHDVALNRQGAAVIAVEAVILEMGTLPKVIRLLGYATDYWTEGRALAERAAVTDIAERCETLSLGTALHVFEIEADGTRFRVAINGKQTELIKIG